MNLFSVNQVNQVYVANNTASKITSGEGTLAADLGSVYCGITPDAGGKPKSIYFKHRGKGGVTRTDIIDIDKIMYYHVTKGTEMKTALNQVVLKLSDAALDSNSKVQAGYDYTIRIKLNHYIGISPEDSQYWKYGMVHSGPNMTATDFWKAMAKSILRNMSREAVKFIKLHAVTTSGSDDTVEPAEVTLQNLDTAMSGATGLAIRETEPAYILGLKQQKIMSIQVTPIPVEIDGELVYWVSGQSEDTAIKAEASSEVINNSKLAADYEYFFHGERGDQYRYVGWPDYIPTEYMANPNAAYGYDFVQIHYSYIGSNEGVQKSEKDLTFLVERVAGDSTNQSASAAKIKAFIDSAVNAEATSVANAAIAAAVEDGTVAAGTPVGG